MSVIRHSVEVDFADKGVRELKAVLENVPDNATVRGRSRLVGYGPGEHEVFVGVTFTWSEQ